MKHISADSVSVRTVKSTDIIIIVKLFILFSDYRILCLSAFDPQCSLNKRNIYASWINFIIKRTNALRMQKVNSAIASVGVVLENEASLFRYFGRKLCCLSLVLANKFSSVFHEALYQRKLIW